MLEKKQIATEEPEQPPPPAEQKDGDMAQPSLRAFKRD
jgi:hypothetical protein